MAPDAILDRKAAARNGRISEPVSPVCINDLDNEHDMQPKQACTSLMQQWHQEGMEVVVHKTHQDLNRSSSRQLEVQCQLYEARTL